MLQESITRAQKRLNKQREFPVRCEILERTLQPGSRSTKKDAHSTADVLRTRELFMRTGSLICGR